MSTYRRLYAIGSGGMGQVFEARRILAADADPDTDDTDDGDHQDDRVACKTMHRHLQTDERYLAWFLREARLNLRISHNHPGLVTVFDFIEDQSGRYHLIMELVRGCNLEAIGNHFGNPPWDIVRLIAADTLDVLAYVHGHDIVHRDISPSNILVSTVGTLKVADLGLSKRRDREDSDASNSRGAAPPGACADTDHGRGSRGTQGQPPGPTEEPRKRTEERKRRHGVTWASFARPTSREQTSAERRERHRRQCSQAAGAMRESGPRVGGPEPA